MPDEIDADLYDAAFAFRFHAMDSEHVFNIESVTVWNVSGSINAGNANVSWTVFNDAIGFHGWCRLDKLAINLEVSVYSSHLMNSFTIVNFIFGRGGLFPARHDHVFGSLADIEFVKRIRGII